MVLRKLGQRMRATVEEEVVTLIAFTPALLCDHIFHQAAYFEDESAGLDAGEGDGGNTENPDVDSDENKVCCSFAVVVLHQP
jgi:hypothetical protein